MSLSQLLRRRREAELFKLCLHDGTSGGRPGLGLGTTFFCGCLFVLGFVAGLLQNIVVEVSMADGRNYVFMGASVTEPPKHSATDGTCDVSFEALAGMEV